MIKKPLRIIMISTLGFIIGTIYIFIFPNENSLVFFTIGLLCIILSFGLFKLWNWTRITVIIFSWIFIAIFLFLVAYAITGMEYHHGFGWIGVIVHFPLLLLCIWVIDYLNHTKTKELFQTLKNPQTPQ